MRTVGILGGMGPAATVELMARVIRAVPATDDADHVPLLVDQNPQVPSRIAHLIDGTGPDPAPVLAAMARRLVGAGARALAMPCNTAHAWAETIRAAVPVPFLDMVALTVAQAAARVPGGRVAILGSPALRRAGVYDGPCRAAGLVPVWPQDEGARLALIRAVKRDGALPDHRAAFASLAAAAQADLGIVACTEFSALADPGPGLIDSLDVLVAAIVAFATGDDDG